MGTHSPLIVGPAMRWVNGSMTKLVVEDHLKRPLKPEKYHYSVGLAARKDDPGTNVMLQAMAAHAFSEFSKSPVIQTGIISKTC